MRVTFDKVKIYRQPKIQPYCAIGKFVCIHSSEGIEVMASEYIRVNYTVVQGFSPSEPVLNAGFLPYL